MAPGRGRLSSIETLGEDYDDIVLWAATELRDRKKLQKDILGELNDQLAARAAEIGEEEAPQISSSAFGRYSIRLAQMTRRLHEVREISKVLTEKLQPGDTDTVTVALAEAIKTTAFEVLRDAGEAGLGMEDLRFAADALNKAVSAQRGSADMRAKMEKALAEKLAAAVEQRTDGDGAPRKIDKADLLRAIREAYG